MDTQAQSIRDAGLADPTYLQAFDKDNDALVTVIVELRRAAAMSTRSIPETASSN